MSRLSFIFVLFFVVVSLVVQNKATAGIQVVPHSLTFEGHVFSLKEMKSAWVFGMNTTNRLLIVAKQNPKSASWAKKIEAARTGRSLVRVTIDSKENLVTSVEAF